MTRMRTHQSKYFTVSNKTAQNGSLSFEALGLLTYCLSMPGDWVFHPKLIWKERNCGRDKLYSLFNQLILAFHCIRVRFPNPKAKGLPGPIEYEFFDDVEDCQARIKELEDSGLSVEHPGNLKKSFRHPDNKYVGNQDIVNQYITKETKKEKKENNKQGAVPQTPIVVVPSFIKEIEGISDEDRKALAKYPEERIKLAIEFNKQVTPTKTKIQQLIWHCKADNPPVPSPKNRREVIKDYCKKVLEDFESKTCDFYFSDTSAYFISHIGQGGPKVIEFSDPDSGLKIKNDLIKNKFRRKKKP